MVRLAPTPNPPEATPRRGAIGLVPLNSRIHVHVSLHNHIHIHIQS